jgi:hypothetical protein
MAHDDVVAAFEAYLDAVEPVDNKRKGSSRRKPHVKPA